MKKNQDNEIFKEFLIESFENLSNISDEITMFEKDPSKEEVLNSIYRKVHTVKGSASFLNLSKLQSVTHVSENLLDLIRDGSLKISTLIVDSLLENVDVCLNILRIIEETGKEGDADYSGVVSKTVGIIESCQIKNEVYKEEVHLVDETFKKIKEGEKTLVERVVDTVNNTEKRETIKPPAPRESTSLKTNNDKKKVGPSKVVTPKTKGVADSVVKVNVQLLDKIMNVVGELVLNRNQIMQFSHTQESPELNRLSIQLNGITTELQQDVMTTRMQPVGSVLNKFERIVRDLARSQDKKIHLNLSGQDTELDKSLIESIRDPLTHLVRNSVDHGIEKPLDRIDKGKPEEGSINIKAYHEGGQVTIEIQDDGNGIDSEEILKKAIEKGVVTNERAATMGDQEVLNLIFSPGFSTAEQVTSISGRGVGMDVVKSNIEKIRGTVDISSILGEGTSFKLKIPLTLAIVPSLIVRDAGETYALPQINLVELVRIDSESENQIESVHDSEFYRLRERLVPIFRLSSILGDNKFVNDDENTNICESLNIVMLNADGVMFGLVVDTILDTEEIVVKPLSQKLKELDIYAGATIMGDGSVALILDAMGFYSHVSQCAGESKELIDKYEEKSKDSMEELQEYVLCKLANEEIYAFPLCYVSRLEEFDGKNIEQSGDTLLIRYRDSATPLIDVVNLFNNTESKTNRVDPEVSYPTIMVENNGNFIGLVVDEIRDIAVSTENISSDVYSGNGILGTVYINESTITVLDLYGIIEKFGFSTKRNVGARERKGARILLLEDSPLYQKMVCELFSSYEHEIVVCENGELGLEKIQHDGTFDLVLTDINMPIVDGPSFMKQVRSRKNEAYSNIPIVAISYDANEEDIKRNIEEGFDSYVEKNMQDEIVETVQKLLAA